MGILRNGPMEDIIVPNRFFLILTYEGNPVPFVSFATLKLERSWSIYKGAKRAADTPAKYSD